MKTNMNKSLIVATVAMIALSACGGGGGSSSPGTGSTGSGSTGTGGGTTTPSSYTVSVLVSGLGTSDTLALNDNGNDPLTMSANGTASFAKTIASGGSYNVTAVQPADSACTVQNGSGTATTNMTVTIICGYSEPSNTTVAAPVYSADSDLKTAFFNDLNTLRGQMGISVLAQNSMLDTEAQAHANYLSLNYTTTMATSGVDPSTGLEYAHSEDVGNSGFYASTPQLRATKSGYATTANLGQVGEVAYAFPSTSNSVTSNASTGHEFFQGFMKTVYHRAILLGNSVRDIGIGFTAPQGEFVADVGALGLTQITPATFTYTYPVNGSTFAPNWISGDEAPNPTPSIPTGTNIGNPISIFCGSDHQITSNNFILTNSSSNTVPTQPVIIFGNSAFLIPTSPLQLGMTYTVNFTGMCDKTAVTKSWNFNTPAAVMTVTPMTSLTMKAGGTVSFSVVSPSGNSIVNFVSETNYTTSTSIATTDGINYTFTTPANGTFSQSIVTLQVSDSVYPSLTQTIQITVNP